MDGVRTSHMGDVIQDVYRGIDAYRVSDEGEVERIDDKLQKLIMGPMDKKEEIVELSRANLELLKDPYVVGAAAPSTLIHYIYFDEEGHAFYAPLESNFMFNPSNMFKVDERLRVFYQSDGGYLTNTVLVGVITISSGMSVEKNERRDKPHVFVVEDVLVCNGVDVAPRPILERMAYFQEKVMGPRQKALRSGSIPRHKEWISLDVVEYKELSDAAQLIRNRNPNRIVFVPKYQRYLLCGRFNHLHWGHELQLQPSEVFVQMAVPASDLLLYIESVCSGSSQGGEFESSMGRLRLH